MDVAAGPDAPEPQLGTPSDPIAGRTDAVTATAGLGRTSPDGDPAAVVAPVVAPVLTRVDSIDGARRERLRQLYEAHYGDLVRLACLLLDRTEAAEEVVQDAFVKLYGALDRIEDRDATPAYLRSMVMNGARSTLRRRQVVRKHPPTPEPHGEPADATAVLHEDQQEVIEALRSLPTRQRECLVLRYYGGCSEAEIADTLGIARGTVKSSISRAMATMSERLEGRR